MGVAHETKSRTGIDSFIWRPLRGRRIDSLFVEEFLALGTGVKDNEDLVVAAALQALSAIPPDCPTLPIGRKIDLAVVSLALGYTNHSLQDLATGKVMENKFGIPQEKVTASAQRIQGGEILPSWLDAFDEMVDINGGRPIMHPAGFTRGGFLGHVVSAEGKTTWPEWAKKNNLKPKIIRRGFEAIILAEFTT